MLLLLLSCLIVLTETRLVYRTPSARSGRALGSQKDAVQSLPDSMKTATDLIEATGYIAETHEVITKDGYILHLHRLPNPNLNTSKVVLLVHGIASSSDNWMLYQEKAFPPMLLKAGYDVWLGSARGSVYSRRHTKYKDGDERFWDYSLHEMALNDLPAFIDTALNVTGASKLFLIGHSRGTTTSYILLSMRPEYNEKVKLLLSFAPVAYMKHIPSVVVGSLYHSFTVPQARQVFRDYLNVKGMGRITGNGMRAIRYMLCGMLPLTDHICIRVIAMIMGWDYLNDRSFFTTYFTHLPDGVSIIELLHYMQIAKTDKLTPYDYGSYEMNMKMYNVTSPIDSMEYDLSKIRTPVSFHYAVDDKFTAVKDVMKLIDQIPNVAGVFKVPYKKFNHVNFIIGSKADKLLYKPTLAFMESFLTSEQISLQNSTLNAL